MTTLASDANEQSSTKADKKYVDDELAKKATTSTVTAIQQELEEKAATISKMQQELGEKATTSTVTAIQQELGEKVATISKMQATIDVMNTALEASATQQAADCDAKIATAIETVNNEFITIREELAVVRELRRQRALDRVEDDNGGAAATTTVVIVVVAVLVVVAIGITIFYCTRCKKDQPRSKRQNRNPRQAAGAAGP